MAAGALAAIVLGVWLAMRDTSTSFNLADVAGTLQLANGRSVGPSLTATLTDPKWDSLSPAARKKAVSAVMDVESPKGIRSLILLDGTGTTRAMVTETPTGRTISAAMTACVSIVIRVTMVLCEKSAASR